MHLIRLVLVLVQMQMLVLVLVQMQMLVLVLVFELVLVLVQPRVNINKILSTKANPITPYGTQLSPDPCNTVDYLPAKSTFHCIVFRGTLKVFAEMWRTLRTLAEILPVTFHSYIISGMNR